MLFIELVALALVLELTFGWPDKLFTLIKHPVVWIGSIINALESRLNHPTSSDFRRYVQGVVTTLIVIAVCVGVTFSISYLIPNNLFGLVFEAAITSSLLASRSLYTHVNAVVIPLLGNDLIQARNSLSHIVGRDTKQLDETSISGATIESLAENASDGVYAPLFWGCLFGLPGIAGYKAINTLDSMIGHRTPQFLYFGRFAAKLDDVANLVPSRLSAMLIALAGRSLLSFSAIAHEAKQHRSPNAGWPESAMAHSLNIRLSGPRTYNNTISNEPLINPTGVPPKATDIKRALRVYSISLGLTLALLILSIFSKEFLS